MRHFLAVYDLPVVSDIVSDDGKPDFEITAADNIENIFEEYGTELWAMFVLGIIVGFFLTLIFYGLIKLFHYCFNDDNQREECYSIKTISGIRVQSFTEKIICDEFSRRGIRFEYKKTIMHQKENEKIVSLHPDLYLPDYKLCLKNWDSQDEKREAELKRLYNAKGYKFSIITTKNAEDIQTTITRVLLENDIKV